MVMFCPNCGRDCGDARFCSACGTQLWQANNPVAGVVREFPKPPVEIVKNHIEYLEEGYLKFGENSLRLVARLPRVPPKNVLIPYQELFDVSYIPATKHWIGFLCVRKWEDRHIPLPQTFWEKKLADSMIWFSQKDNDDFCRAYVFLKEIARINASRRSK